MILPLDICQTLKAKGYPQDRFPLFVYYHRMGNSSPWRVHYFEDLDGGVPGFGEWCAAPDPLDVLAWLEEQGWHFHIVLGSSLGPDMWFGVPKTSVRSQESWRLNGHHERTPEDLIRACLEAMP